MESDDIPRPSPPDRIRALLAEALVRSGRQAAASARLAGLLSDAPVRPEAAKTRLYVVLLTESNVSEKVCAALKRSCGCTAVVAVGDQAWIVEAPGGLHRDMLDKLNAVVERRHSVFALEIGKNFAGAYQEKDKSVGELLIKYK